MKYTNITTIKEFIIIGFPGLPPEYYGPVSVLLLLVFLAIVIGNGFTIAVIIFERTLHKPIYVIFSNLAMTDICFGVVTLPKIIATTAKQPIKCYQVISLIIFYHRILEN
uniref:G-protein coupled receptors family 1 profile domain-containing protein n=1 Tax=Neolamprologus brichardi TaxID=32507 RepID=A0A3Q4I7S8_NEOBR